MNSGRRIPAAPKMFVASGRRCATPKPLRRRGGADMDDHKGQVFESAALKQASDRAAEQRGSLREALSSISDKSSKSPSSGGFSTSVSKGKVAASGG